MEEIFTLKWHEKFEKLRLSNSLRMNGGDTRIFKENSGVI